MEPCYRVKPHCEVPLRKRMVLSGMAVPIREKDIQRKCNGQLLLSGVLYSALTNAGLAVRSLPFATALVIKNGNIIANMVVGRLAGRRYTTWQV